MNPYAKTVKRENAHAVYSWDGWTWYILKMYQSPERASKNPYARAFCLVTSPVVGERGELGDVYLKDIQGKFIRGTNILNLVAKAYHGIAESSQDALGCVL